MRLESYIYIHVPFCVRKCPYCDFYSVPCSQPAIGHYIEALRAELKERLPEGASPRTLYIGGGTPTAPDIQELNRFFNTILARVNPSRLEEFTIEVNPGTLSEEKISVLKQHGVNRISLGVQSFEDAKLKKLGRIHNGTEAREAFENFAAAGFENIGIDLIYGVPGDGEKTWLDDLKKAVELKPKHVSLYCLSVEPGTEFDKRRERGELALPGEDLQKKLYFQALDFLEGQGFNHYEISNFALPGYESRHNSATWRYEPYMGFGPSAASFDGSVRRRNAADIEAYCSDPVNAAESEEISVSQRAGEVMMLALRTLEGISGEEFHARSGLDMEETYGENIRELEKRGLLERVEDRIKLTRDALFISDEVFVEFF